MISNLNQLRHFVALAERGSFTEAAESSSRSQPALSRSIAMLEADLGVRLFDRIGRRSELTPVGQAVLSHARHVIFEADELVQSAKSHKDGAVGHLRIGLGSTPSALLTVPLLEFFATRSRSARASVFRGSVEQQMQSLRGFHLDVLVVEMSAVMPAPDLHIEHLADCPVGLLCRREHPLALRGGYVSFADLQRYPIASTTISHDVARSMVEAYGPAAHPDEFVTLCCEDIPNLLEAVCNSDAIYMGALAPGRGLVAKQALQPLSMWAGSYALRFALVRLAGRSVSPLFTQVRALIADHLKG